MPIHAPGGFGRGVMQTSFTLAQLADADIASANDILRKCVHCGFCVATCPTYVLLGDELDSPRGRIYLIKEMLEHDRPASPLVALHIDRCLSCLACMTTCPSGVNYMHLVDHARAHIEETYKRPLLDRLLRATLAWTMPVTARFRLALALGRLARPLRALLPEPRLRALLTLMPARRTPASPVDRPQTIPAEGTRRLRVALLTGCVQPALRPEINEATVRLLVRHGCEVVMAQGAGCCGSLAHHLGRAGESLAAVRNNVDAWMREVDGAGLDAIVINASGCGTTVKDYGYMLRQDPDYADQSARISALARDVTEVMDELGLMPPAAETGLAVAYHSACSMQHGQAVNAAPRKLLAAAGFTVREVPEGHLCCGSAGTYNILQPALAAQLKSRKLENIAKTGAAVVATGNIGCIAQLERDAGIPVVHTVELLDWATGGPKPDGV